MKLTLTTLQRVLRQAALALQGIVAVCLVIYILFVINQDVFAKTANVQLIEDIPDNSTSQHPSRKDRNTEHGNSGTQGKSQSNPDGNGADKRRDARDEARGGSQGNGDYDDNNGCGNDHDFADDNNGNCGGKPKPSHSPKPSPSPRPNASPSPKPSVSPKPTPHKVKICHATGSSTNPYVLIEVDDQDSLNGHKYHSQDIIPAPTYGCPKPKYNPSPSPNPSPSTSPSPTPSPTPNVGSPNDPDKPASNNSNSESSIKILGVNVPKELPATGLGLLSLILTLGAMPVGLLLSRYKKI